MHRVIVHFINGTLSHEITKLITVLLAGFAHCICRYFGYWGVILSFFAQHCCRVRVWDL